MQYAGAMRIVEVIVAGATLVGVVVAAISLVPLVFGERVLPGVELGPLDLSGVAAAQVPGMVRVYEQQLRNQQVELVVRGEHVARSLGELGLRLNPEVTIRAIYAMRWPAIVAGQRHVRPAVTFESSVLQQEMREEFGGVLNPPRNATLQLSSGNQLVLVPGTAGDGVDIPAFEREIAQRAQQEQWHPLPVTLVAQAPAVEDDEVDQAQEFAMVLLRGGVELTWGETHWTMPPATARRLLEFVEQVDRGEVANKTLAVRLNETELASYLATTIAPEINRPARDARFAMDETGRVTQFAVSEEGRELDVAGSAASIAEQVRQRQTRASLLVAIAVPAVATVEDIEALGLKERLAVGESSFAGSPANRIHNITVGTERYHGLLLPPGSEFSFNHFLGPVTAAAGFKPELVIKHNVTTPEFGGGLCQVSTTMFRAAVAAGLEVTARRNHAYAVRYYGTPGFDATIYPPYTDLRFTNNTPGYVLIQAKQAGTVLQFEFWGTSDGRVVEVAGPFPYDRQANGAVRARLTQKVTRDGAVIIDETFSSRYKSPDLFPKIVAADTGR